MGGCAPSRQPKPAERRDSDPSRNRDQPVKDTVPLKQQGSNNWTAASADKLQEAVDRIFGTTGRSLLGLEFSFTIADPLLDGCPLIGCSTGFTKLCGYELNEIVGRNCRFLVDPVPGDKIDAVMRRQTRDFCDAVRSGREYKRPADNLEPWMDGRPSDEFLALQMNARKDGSFFNNMFLLKVVDLGSELGKERPYIVALQSELPMGKLDLEKVSQNLVELDQKIGRVKRELSSWFYMRGSLMRQAHSMASLPVMSDPSDSDCQAPQHLHSAFDSAQVQPWSQGGFKRVKKLADATRNGGVVWLMEDPRTNKLVAVKQMPNTWMRSSHDEFIRVHPRESEMPWQDVGATKFLNSVNYKYACNLEGVYRNDEHTFVVSAFCSEGDLFSTAEGGEPPGPKRETAFMPIVVEFFEALQLLHDMQIVHRDISLENVLRTKGPDGKYTIKIIDFGMSSTGRKFRNCPRGKASYEAPDMQTEGDYDAFLSDTFAAGVVVYAMFLKDYPWLSTKPGRDKCFEYVKQEGFRAYCAKRCVRGSQKRISECLSEHLMQLLEGMLCIDPKRRLTLGEKDWSSDRKSVWDTSWMKGHVSF